MKKFFAFGILSLSFLIISAVMPKKAAASEGLFELRNTVGEDTRCFVSSVLMKDQNYNLLVSCRDILYPGGTSVFQYVLWLVPAEGGNPQRLGTLGVGKVSFSTKTAFSSLYVTKETTDNPRSPTGPVIMRGNLQRITFLEGIPSPIPTSELGVPETTPTPTPQPRTGLTRFLALGGVISFIVIFVIILIIFLITKR